MNAPAAPPGAGLPYADPGVSTARYRRHGPLALAAIVVSALMVVAMLAVIYARWVRVAEPTAAIVVEGDESLAGAVVTVEGEGMKPLSVTLDAGNKYASPVLVRPGIYTVTTRLNGAPVGRSYRLPVAAYQGRTLYLTEWTEARARARATGQKVPDRPPPSSAAPPPSSAAPPATGTPSAG